MFSASLRLQYNYFLQTSQIDFFVYPDPKGSEENQFTLLGDGVNKLIFERLVRIFSVTSSLPVKLLILKFLPFS
jgi:hypothetical protein